MKFLKYLLFLLLIVASGVLLFFATQDSNFEISESHNLEAPPEVIFNFLNDYKNWAHFGTWNDDETLQMSFSQVTSGVGASYSWKSEKSGKGAMETLYVEPYEKIVQKMVFNGSLKDEGYQVIWQIEPKPLESKVTWSMSGKWGLIEKIIFYFNDIDMEYRLSQMFTKSLISLENAIENKLNLHSIDVAGLTLQPEGFYLSSSMMVKIDEVNETLEQLYQRLSYFMESNAIEATGPHFLLTNTIDDIENSVLITVGFPVEDFILLPEDTAFYSGYFEETAVVKVRLAGSISFMEEAIYQAENYIENYNLTRLENKPLIVKYIVSIKDTDNPLEWITEIFIPVENAPNQN